MSIVVYLISGINGEIKRFLESFYEKEINMDNDVGKWIYVYNKPIEAVDIMSAVIDNNDNYKISLCIQLGDGDIHHVNKNNCNDIIRGIFELFYEQVNEQVTNAVC